MSIDLSHDEMKAIAKAAAKEAVQEVLIVIGVNVSDPQAIVETQRDFVVIHELARLALDSDFRKDLEFVREWRLSTQSLRKTSVRVAVGLIVTAALGALWLGLQQLMTRGH
ncbi:hypothetical protein RA307_23720 [Xanthobacteraceae bacterium Astr-EGSB]|uniref:hypothetical protein n=1 Tax=Astrobacterium formosum TaxID=3069710 RepID=UPI0027B43EA6|nr:hypothetical protein [Xanthobacteraceae bacterium Astr-EGSB]MDQ2083204.1 hypothetical protein [Xanthobacteraceae bacterium Astr-EGSB]